MTKKQLPKCSLNLGVVEYYQTWKNLSTKVLGTIYLPFFCKNPNNFIAIGIGCTFYF